MRTGRAVTSRERDVVTLAGVAEVDLTEEADLAEEADADVLREVLDGVEYVRALLPAVEREGLEYEELVDGELLYELDEDLP